MEIDWAKLSALGVVLKIRSNVVFPSIQSRKGRVLSLEWGRIAKDSLLFG